MANMSPTKNPIPEQDPNVRNKNFEEVALGYTVEMAVDEDDGGGKGALIQENKSATLSCNNDQTLFEP